ncbi:MAG: BON domain-containing protein [Gemmatimonadota bacterium]|nr:BON domain-containing protein [Gemmatimonadota bacterium]
MKRIRLHDDAPSVGSMAAGVTLGALAGFVAGVVVAQRVGGLSGLSARIRERFDALVHHGQQELESLAGDDHDEGDESDDEYEDDYENDAVRNLEADGDSALEERVLRAFRRDATLSERAIDIGAIGEGIIELSGWVETHEESEHAMSVTRTVPGIVTVVSRLFIGADEQNASDLDEDDLDDGAPIPGGVWEGQRVGTGRRRQGNSGEVDRHSDPKPIIEDKWLDEDHALEEAAGPIEGIAERRTRKAKKSEKPSSTNGDDSGAPSTS